VPQAVSLGPLERDGLTSKLIQKATFPKVLGYAAPQAADLLPRKDSQEAGWYVAINYETNAKAGP
jgi:hypothetical protein